VLDKYRSTLVGVVGMLRSSDACGAEEAGLGEARDGASASGREGVLAGCATVRVEADGSACLMTIATKPELQRQQVCSPHECFTSSHLAVLPRAACDPSACSRRPPEAGAARRRWVPR
jgi:hypothetical protein